MPSLNEWLIAMADKVINGALSVTGQANQTVNLSQVAGSATASGAGATTAGTQRVALASDTTLAPNQSVNVAQLAGTVTAVGAGAVSAGVQRTVQAGGATASLFQNTAASLATAQAVRPADATRLGMLLENGSDKKLYFRFGATNPTTTAYGFSLAPGEKYEVPRALATLELRAIAADGTGIGSLNCTSVV